MERTRDNLLRVQDVLRELDRQMGSLQRQAKRAEEYHRLKGALRELDLRVMARSAGGRGPRDGRGRGRGAGTAA